MRSAIKRFIPLWLRKAAYRAVSGSVTLYKLRYLPYLLRFSHFQAATPTLDLAAVRNVLPNTGGIPIEASFASAREIVQRFSDAAHRSLDIAGFEGFAADDAVFDARTQQAEMWSYAPLAGAIAAFCHNRYTHPSVLDLGCGPAHLFHFLRELGIGDYLGIDGNPWFIHFNPHLAGHESHFAIQNLQEEIQLRAGERPLVFDVICSFEVLEHIREDRVDDFIRTMRNHMHARSTAFCTASLQAGMDVHVLVRPREWWLDRFAQHGLFPIRDEAEWGRRIGENHSFNWNPRISSIFVLEARTP